MFGELLILSGPPRSAPVTGVSDSVVCEIVKEHLDPIVRQRPELAGSLAEVMVRHQRYREE